MPNVTHISEQQRRPSRRNVHLDGSFAFGCNVNDVAVRALDDGRLAKLDPAVARRRLVGMLQRRGFDYDAIKPVVDEVLGPGGHGGRK